MDEVVRSDEPVQADVVSSQPPKKPRTVEGDMVSLARWLFTHNPFYVVSAALMFVGLRMSFDTGCGEAYQIGALMGCLTAYTILLAATAWFLIRYGKLWQDVRTVLIVVVLLFVAMSVSFDSSFLELPELRTRLAVGGLAFSVVLSELLLRGIRLRLPFGFRLPYYALLALFWLYPAIVSTWAGEAKNDTLKWLLFGFSTIAGAIMLTLLPAVRRGYAYVANNGSPWSWPWYPWTLFVVIGLCVCLRAYSLCISFHAVDGSRSIFAPYFLVPFLWVAAYLLLEIGMVSHRSAAVFIALLAPIGLVAMSLTAVPGTSKEVDLVFLRSYHGVLGFSPLFMSLMASMAFYVIAWARRAPGALIGFFLTAAAFSVCGADTFGLHSFSGPHAAPILAVGLVILALGVKKGRAEYCLPGCWFVVISAWIAFHDTAFTVHHGAIPIHLLLLCMLLVGAAFRDTWGRAIQTLGAAALLVFALIAALAPARVLGNPPQAIVTFYPVAIAVVAVVYGLLVKNAWYYAAALGSLLGWSAVPGWKLFTRARDTLPGLNYIAWGAASFFLALLFSLIKMGVVRRLFDRCQKRDD